MRDSELAVRESVRDLLARYNFYGDRGRFDELLELFADEATLVTDGATYVGRAAIRQLFTGAVDDDPQRIRHFTSTVVIDLVADDRVTARSYFQVLAGAGLDHWGTYRDVVVRLDGQWRLARREVRVDGMTPGGWAERRMHGHDAP
ncbi:MAG TPA: nuclear transport factor 2 family protein [Mycobacteriales bacterium]|nr:nuclear transport factor 2 family protein [Mycobacteriales bacterium]